MIALAWPDGRVDTVEGSAEGRILEAPRGALGFGYDPLFYSPALDATFSEVEAERKLRVSHRGQALAQLRQMLQGTEKKP